MKTVITLILLLVTVSFADAQKNKNKEVPVPTKTAKKPKKDFTSWLAKHSSTATKITMQFYPGDTIFMAKGENALVVETNAAGDVIVVDRSIVIPTDRKGTFVRMDNDGTCWISFTLTEKEYLPGDTVIVPFNLVPDVEGDNISYVLRAPAESKPGVPGKNAQVEGSTYNFNGNKFTLTKGINKIPIKVVVSAESKPVVTKDKPVNAPASAAPEKSVNPLLDPFIPPVE